MAHSPAPSSESLRPGTLAGSIWNVRQNEALAAMIVRSPARNNSGSFDEAITARVLVASTWEEVNKPMDVVLGPKTRGLRAVTRQKADRGPHGRRSLAQPITSTVGHLSLFVAK